MPRKEREARRLRTRVRAVADAFSEIAGMADEEPDVLGEALLLNLSIQAGRALHKCRPDMTEQQRNDAVFRIYGDISDKFAELLHLHGVPVQNYSEDGDGDFLHAQN